MNDDVCAQAPYAETAVAEHTAWCSEIGSPWSLDAPELHASVMSENQFHCTRLYLCGLFNV